MEFLMEFDGIFHTTEKYTRLLNIYAKTIYFCKVFFSSEIHVLQSLLNVNLGYSLCLINPTVNCYFYVLILYLLPQNINGLQLETNKKTNRQIQKTK